MGQIQFEHEECNAWGLFDKTAIVADNSNNLHIAEIAVSSNRNGEITYELNHSNKAVCGEKVNGSNGQKVRCFDDDSGLRLLLAILQNEGIKVCGRCVAHFHRDQE